MTIETDLPYRPCVGVMLINRDGRVIQLGTFVGDRHEELRLRVGIDERRRSDITPPQYKSGVTPLTSRSSLT